ncbi:MAG: hypothetical protein IPL26_16840 [Leptospiraceae bacterium]|nr:hypothetical protein [Leptospiraceae bacterium]
MLSEKSLKNKYLSMINSLLCVTYLSFHIGCQSADMKDEIDSDGLAKVMDTAFENNKMAGVDLFSEMKNVFDFYERELVNKFKDKDKYEIEWKGLIEKVKKNFDDVVNDSLCLKKKTSKDIICVNVNPELKKNVNNLTIEIADDLSINAKASKKRIELNIGLLLAIDIELLKRNDLQPEEKNSKLKEAILSVFLGHEISHILFESTDKKGHEFELDADFGAIQLLEKIKIYKDEEKILALQVLINKYRTAPENNGSETHPPILLRAVEFFPEIFRKRAQLAKAFITIRNGDEKVKVENALLQIENTLKIKGLENNYELLRARAVGWHKLWLYECKNLPDLKIKPIIDSPFFSDSENFSKYLGGSENCSLYFEKAKNCYNEIEKRQYKKFDSDFLLQSNYSTLLVFANKRDGLKFAENARNSEPENRVMLNNLAFVLYHIDNKMKAEGIITGILYKDFENIIPIPTDTTDIVIRDGFEIGKKAKELEASDLKYCKILEDRYTPIMNYILMNKYKQDNVRAFQFYGEFKYINASCSISNWINYLKDQMKK